ncbi:MAG TPA: LCP family protein [Streptosporangiaceae bacterium]|nr:LCP family protein [Streptosporangiaceae bacterium]
MGDGGDQQRQEERPRGRRASRLVGWTIVAMSLLLVAVALTGYAAYRELFDKIHRVEITGLGKRPPKFNNSLNILVIGSDSRKGKNARFGAGISGQRSDTIMVLHLSPGLKHAVVLSIPRDSVVPVLNCPRAPGAPGQPAQPGQVEQINATFALGGPGCLWKTVEHTTHLRLDHFMELNFTGFEHVINDLGGVDICLPYSIKDPRSKLRLSAGLHHVWGAEALAYWRVRYIGMGSDLERIQRDQYLMASLAQKIKHTDLFDDPARLIKIVSDIASSLTTDSGLNQGTLLSLAESLHSMKLSNVHFIQVPVLPYPQNKNWVVWAPSSKALFTAIAHDRKVPRHQQKHKQAHKTATPTVSQPSASPSPGFRHLTKTYGGINGHANVCRDQSAFTGPLGGH